MQKCELFNVTYFLTQTELPIHAPAAGIIEELLVGDGAKVEANAQLFKLRITGKIYALNKKIRELYHILQFFKAKHTY